MSFVLSEKNFEQKTYLHDLFTVIFLISQIEKLHIFSSLFPSSHVDDIYFEGNFSFSNKKLSGIPFVHLRWFNAQQKSNETREKRRKVSFFRLTCHLEEMGIVEMFMTIECFEFEEK